MRKQRIALKYGIYIALVRGQCSDVFSKKIDLTLIRLLEAGNDAQGRRLAAARSRTTSPSKDFVMFFSSMILRM